MDKKRLRMFACPNGSGKSTLKRWIEEKMPERQLFGNYINPDDIEAHVRATQTVDFTTYGLHPTKNEVLDFFLHSPFLQQVQLSEEAKRLEYLDGKLSFRHVAMNSYFASVTADFIRQKLVVVGRSFVQIEPIFSTIRNTQISLGSPKSPMAN